MGSYLFKDIINITGIAERIVKYWVQEYGLEFKKNGRNTVFSEETKNSLLLIKALSDTELYTQKFIKTILECLKTGNTSKLDGILSDMRGLADTPTAAFSAEACRPAPETRREAYRKTAPHAKSAQNTKPQASLEVELL